jgi:cobalt transporter subunit CbtB
MSVQQNASTAPALQTTGARTLPAILAILGGLFIVGFVGFSPMEIVHNVAHDTRHANAFPCH